MLSQIILVIMVVATMKGTSGQLYLSDNYRKTFDQIHRQPQSVMKYSGYGMSFPRSYSEILHQSASQSQPKAVLDQQNKFHYTIDDGIGNKQYHAQGQSSSGVAGTGYGYKTVNRIANNGGHGAFNFQELGTVISPSLLQMNAHLPLTSVSCGYGQACYHSGMGSQAAIVSGTVHTAGNTLHSGIYGMGSQGTIGGGIMYGTGHTLQNRFHGGDTRFMHGTDAAGHGKDTEVPPPTTDDINIANRERRRSDRGRFEDSRITSEDCQCLVMGPAVKKGKETGSKLVEVKVKRSVDLRQSDSSPPPPVIDPDQSVLTDCECTFEQPLNAGASRSRSVANLSRGS